MTANCSIITVYSNTRLLNFRGNLPLTVKNRQAVISSKATRFSRCTFLQNFLASTVTEIKVFFLSIIINIHNIRINFVIKLKVKPIFIRMTDLPMLTIRKLPVMVDIYIFLSLATATFASITSSLKAMPYYAVLFQSKLYPRQDHSAAMLNI